MMAVIIITVTLGIISRYVFGAPFPWTEELGLFLFVWVSFLGANVTAARKNHVVVDLLARKFSGRKVIFLKIIIDILVITFLIILGIGAIKLQPQTAGHTSVTLGIPKNLYYLPALITSFYMLLVFGCDLLEQLFEFRKAGILKWDYGKGLAPQASAHNKENQ